MSLERYGFTGSSPRQRSDFVTQKHDAWTDATPRRGRALGPIEKGDTEELGNDLSSESEGERLALTKEGPIDLDSGSDDEEVSVQQGQEEKSESEAPVQPKRRLVKGAQRPAPLELTSASEADVPCNGNAGSSDSDDVQVVMSEKAKGKRRARSSTTDTMEDEVIPVAAPYKKKQRPIRSDDLPEVPLEASGRKLVRGKPTSSFSLIVPSTSHKKRTSPIAAADTPSSESDIEISDRKTRSATKADVKQSAKEAKSKKAKQPKSKDTSTPPVVHPEIDWTEGKRALRRQEAKEDPKRFAKRRSSGGGSVFQLSLLSNDVDDDRASQPLVHTRDRSDSPVIVQPKASHQKRKWRQKAQVPEDSPEPSPELDEDDELPDPSDLGHMFNRNRIREHNMKEAPHRFSDEVVPESDQSAREPESDIEDDISLDRNVLVDDRLRPERKKQDKFAALKAARAGKAKAEDAEPLTIESDEEPEERPKKRPRVVDLDSSSDEDEIEADDHPEVSKDDPDNWIVSDDENDPEAAAALARAKKDMPMQFTVTQSEPLKVSLRDVLLAFTHILMDKTRDYWKESPEWANGRQRTRARIDELLPSLVKSSVWTASFNEAIDTYPDFSSSSLSPEAGCDVCGSNSKISTYLITLSGQRYDRETLKKHKKRSADSDPPTFRAGRFCHERAVAYHRLKHWEFTANEELRGEIKVPGGMTQAEGVAWANHKLSFLDRKGGVYDRITREVEDDLEQTRKRFGT